MAFRASFRACRSGTSRSDEESGLVLVEIASSIARTPKCEVSGFVALFGSPMCHSAWPSPPCFPLSI